MLPESPMVACPTCSKKTHPQYIKERGHCWDCYQKIEQANCVAKFKANLSGHIAEHLFKGGIGRAELYADWNQVPSQLAKAIPEDWLDQEYIGFGLGGNTGIGKTMALVAGLQRIMSGYAVEKMIPSIQNERGPSMRFPSFQWSCWPSEVHWLRGHAIDGADERAAELVNARILVLDDLGRERIKGDFTQDYAFSHLDYIITERYRNGLPTIWTTNLKVPDLAQLYGAPTLRRLIEPNPLNWVEGLKAFNLSRRTA